MAQVDRGVLAALSAFAATTAASFVLSLNFTTAPPSVNPLVIGIGAAIGAVFVTVALMAAWRRQRREIPPRTCPACGRGIPFDSSLCPYCGYRFGAPQ